LEAAVIESRSNRVDPRLLNIHGQLVTRVSSTKLGGFNSRRRLNYIICKLSFKNSAEVDVAKSG
jgi:hypothetical protein